MKKTSFTARTFAIILITAITIPGIAVAQAAKPAVYTAPRETIERIREEGMKRSQVMATLSYMTDVIGGRLTGSPGMKRANDWTRDKMKEWGMNAKVEPWGEFGRGWSLRKFSAALIDPEYQPLIAYPAAWSPSTKGAVTSEVVHVAISSPAGLEKFKGKLSGKIALVSEMIPVRPLDKGLLSRFSDDELLKIAGAPAGTQIGGGPPLEAFKEIAAYFNMQARVHQFLIDEGAAVMLNVSSGGTGGTVFVQGANVAAQVGELKTLDDLINSPAFQPHLKKWAPNIMPQAVISVEDNNRLLRIMAAGVKPKLTIEIDAQFQEQDLQGYNTIGEIPGSDPALKDEVVMLGAHLDSWHTSTGATDNAAGSAAIMEAARILMAAGLKPRRAIRIALWSGEEQGLFGSTSYVKKHFGEMKDGKLLRGPAYDRLAAYYNLDNGTGRIRGIYMEGNEAARPFFEAWLAPFADVGATTVSLAGTGGTDHLPFEAIGLPGFQFIQDQVEYETRTHHSNQDNFDRIQAADMKQSSTILAAFAYQTAMMDGKLPRKETKP